MAETTLANVTPLHREGKKIVWAQRDLSILSSLYPTTSSTVLADAFGISIYQLELKAMDLSLSKVKENPYEEIEHEIVSLYPDFSIQEIAENLGIPASAVRNVARKNHLRKTSEQIKAIQSRQRNSLIKKEYARGVFGFEAKSNIRVFRNDKKSKARSRLRESGYLVDRTSSTVYYDENTVRSSRREAFARKLGFVFLPYRDEYEEEAV